MSIRAAGLSLCLLLLVPAARAADPPPRTITVNGEGRATAAPDRAVLAFAVETAAPTAGEAVRDNAARSAALAAAIKAQLGAQDTVSTTQYALSPRYEQPDRPAMAAPPAPPKIVGYVASNAVRVELRDVTAVGALIDAATKAGANRVDDLQFTLEDRAAAQAEALARAGEDARRQAQAAATALGVTLGRVLAATTGSPPVIMPKQFGRMAMAMEADMATPVEAGDVHVSATLQVTYEIQ